jgi:hypothetical protein
VHVPLRLRVPARDSETTRQGLTLTDWILPLLFLPPQVTKASPIARSGRIAIGQYFSGHLQSIPSTSSEIPQRKIRLRAFSNQAIFSSSPNGEERSK